VLETSTDKVEGFGFFGTSIGIRMDTV